MYGTVVDETKKKNLAKMGMLFRRFPEPYGPRTARNRILRKKLHLELQ
jgi:hypothetical protein